MGVRGSLVNILIVDDEPDLRYLMRRVFEQAGHVVTDAGHGQAALEVVRRSRPDLVVTDMMMPVMNGAELIRQLRADPATAQIPILAVTGDAALAGEADAVMHKPWNRQQLLTAAITLLATKADRT